MVDGLIIQEENLIVCQVVLTNTAIYRVMSKKRNDAIDFHEANFVSLRDHGQSNIYSLVHLNIAGHSKLVVATLRAQIFCLEYQKDSLRPLLTPINFTYIPGIPKYIICDVL